MNERRQKLIERLFELDDESFALLERDVAVLITKQLRRKACPDCQGYGRVQIGPSEQACYKCHGSGLV